MDVANPNQDRCKLQNYEENRDDDTDEAESDNDMLVDETEGSSSENSLDTVEEHELEITDNDAEDNEDNDSTDSTTVNMNSDSTNSGTDEGIPHLTRSQMNNQHLAPYICNVCKGYVRGAVITICGHLFCWTCLWPLLESRAYPNCPRCLRRLNLHEDIVPFHGEGPHAEATDANEVAQPGNVERPSGVYLNEYHPEWFAVNEFERLVLNALIESETERNLYDVLLKIPIYHPLIATCIKFLNGIQISLGLLMFILWGFFSLNERN